MRFIQPVANVPGLIRQVQSVLNDRTPTNASSFMKIKTFWRNRVWCSIWLLCTLRRVSSSLPTCCAQSRRFCSRLCFYYEVVQVGGIALFDGAKFDITGDGMISEDMVPLNCRVALALTRPTNFEERSRLRPEAATRHKPIRVNA